jgi:hypothetical protein
MAVPTSVASEERIMVTKISWAAAIVAGSAIIAAGCQTAPEERPSASSASTEAEPRASASDADKTERAGAMGAATTEQQSRSTGDGQASTSPPGGTTTPYEVTGRVDRIDASNIEIAGKTLKIDSSTSVMKGGMGASLDDIKEGDEVRASLSGSGDPEPKAVRIEVMSPPSEAPAGAGTAR